MRTLSALIICLSAVSGWSQTFGLGDTKEMADARDQVESTFGLDGNHAASVAKPKLRDTAPRTAKGEKVLSEPIVTHVAAVSAPKLGLRSGWTGTVAAPYISPSGYHRHVMVDGTIMEHADWNYGDPVAHAGVVGSNWPKYYGPLPPTSVGTVSYVQQSSCPGGVCPTTSRRGLFFRRR